MTIPNYTGEHLLPGTIGQILVLLSFIGSIVAAWLYFQSVKQRGSRSGFHYRKWARIVYMVHLAAIAAVAATLYYLIFYHYFEYNYVYKYSSRELPVQYIISCFWAGQEGSFIVWALWQGLLGLILIKTGHEWETRVMTIVSVAQVFLVSTLLGVHVFGVAIGQSPFALLRDVMGPSQPDFFNNPDYLALIADGNGLNPLLENIWMTTHPPILFLGYAAMLIPFAYAFAGLWRSKPTEWIKPAMPWTLFSLLILGIGIILGGMWAYVSLTFGGFWAWDPVENASLVPWMVLVAALHFQLVARKQNTSLVFAVIFSMAAYFFVLYASYLTKSGILAETSAHSFGENGMVTQLIITLLAFLIIPGILVFKKYKLMGGRQNENMASREFWMFAGSLVVLLATFQILFVTSIPVWNKLFGLSIAPPTEVVAYYNKWQSPYAVLMLLAMGVGSYMHYKSTHLKRFLVKSGIAVGFAAVVTTLLTLHAPINNPVYVALVFSALYTLYTSFELSIMLVRRSISPGGMVSHAGLAVFLIGVVVTFSNTRTISTNTSGYYLGDEKFNRENIMLVRGDTLEMADYLITYQDTTLRGNETFYKVAFLKRSGDLVEKQFELWPSVNRNTRMGYVYNPATYSQLMMDTYTYIAYAEDNPGSTTPLGGKEVAVSDTLVAKNVLIRVDSVGIKSSTKEVDPENITLTAYLTFIDRGNGKLEQVKTSYKVENGIAEKIPGRSSESGMEVVFERVSEQPGKIVLSLFETRLDFIVLHVVENPYINLVWIGTFIMFTGLVMAMMRRMRKLKEE